MNKVQWVLTRWGMLGVALLAGGAVAFHGNQPTITRTPRYASPVYTVPEVLAGWHRHPAQWVGRTILVRASHNSSCNVPIARPRDNALVPCVLDGQYAVSTVLYDAPSREIIPTIKGTAKNLVFEDPIVGSIPPGVTPPTFGDPVWVWRVTLVLRQDCGPLGRGQHPCLVGESPYQMP